ncbi:hypothetical protein P3T76_014766 [Phytophthora citrophthora]|uniref:Uncharacterized protein n=1 Tax=Phytophthora citrophthora TaxID=4793 RepID=A0AAD9G0F7_9STRA|nr:hypothetical protein P3T76_014766 [Phytophthora citrophthora]
MMPEGLDPYRRAYICTHGCKMRKSRGGGSRPKQHIRLTNRPFRFTVQWSLEQMELQVKNGIYKHNHPISSEAYATYLGSRSVVYPENVSTVAETKAGYSAYAADLPPLQRAVTCGLQSQN